MLRLLFVTALASVAVLQSVDYGGGVAAAQSFPSARVTALAAPSLSGPPNGTALQNMGAITLTFQLPAGATQYQVQVTPFNGDGPGANLIRNAESSFTLQPPVLGIGPYVMLPGMTYTWRIRATDKPSFAGEADSSWGPWSDPWSFTTPPPSAESIRPSEPPPGARATSLNPTLVWTDTNPFIFYYEIQLSEDLLFNTNPFIGPTKQVFWNYIHGGQSQPFNSWAVPGSYPLTPGCAYYWRVRPRVQGNGTPVNWPIPFPFIAPSLPGTVPCEQPKTPTPTPTAPVTPVPVTPVPVTPGSSTFRLTVSVATDLGTSGGGSVTSFPLGINCPPVCSASYSAGTPVSLIATPLGGYSFKAWTGDPGCSTGAVTMSTDKACAALFGMGQRPTLSVSKQGTGSGTVTSSPPGINCGPDCSEIYDTGTIVVLTATASSGSSFDGWSGDPDCTDGQVAMNTSKTCIALFTSQATPTPPTAVVTQPPTPTFTPTPTPTFTPIPTPSSVTMNFASNNDASVGTIHAIGSSWPLSDANVRSVSGASNNNAVGVNLGAGSFFLFRSYVSFNTSIPASATILSAKINMWVDKVRNADNTSLEIVSASQGDTLANDDFGRIGSTSFASVPLVSLQQLQMNTIDLNASGIAAINKGGRTQLGLRAGLDLKNQRPNGTADSQNDTATYLDTEQYGIKLIVTYR